MKLSFYISRLRKRANNSAFTLIELLVVIAIIGILAALMFPSISAAKVKSHDAKCKGNLKQIGVAHGLYMLDHGGDLANSRLPRDPKDDEKSVWFHQRLWPYVYEGVATPGFTPENKYGSPKGLENTIFECPQARYDLNANGSKKTTRRRSYGYNERVAGGSSSLPVTASAIVSGNSSALVADSSSAALHIGSLVSRHGEGMFNALFFDGSVRSVEITPELKVWPNNKKGDPFWGIPQN